MQLGAFYYLVKPFSFLALREQLDHRAGHYGTAGNADGVVPEIAN